MNVSSNNTFTTLSNFSLEERCPEFKARILSERIYKALIEANKGNLLGSYRIWNQVLEVQKSSFGLDHNVIVGFDSIRLLVMLVVESDGQRDPIPSRNSTSSF